MKKIIITLFMLFAYPLAGSMTDEQLLGFLHQAVTNRCGKSVLTALGLSGYELEETLKTGTISPVEERRSGSVLNRINATFITENLIASMNVPGKSVDQNFINARIFITTVHKNLQEQKK